MKDLAKYAVNKLLELGAEKGECWVQVENKDELNIHSAKIDLLRTNESYTLKLTGLKDNKKGSVTLNKINKKNIDKMAEKTLKIIESSREDKANDISEGPLKEKFESGPIAPEREKMYENLSNFLKNVKNDFPKIKLEQSILEHTKIENYYENSNDVSLYSKKGKYQFTSMFFSKDGKKTSSFNYTQLSTKNIEKPYYNSGTIKRLLKENQEQLETKSVPQNFKGDLIITPDCMGSFIGFITRYLKDHYIITGNSIFKDKLNKKIANENFSLYSKPLAEEIASNYFITSDGNLAENLEIIKDGNLKSFMLSLYGSNKTGKKRANNSGGCYVIEPGKKSIDDIIKNTDKGIILSRFSGGNPSDNGDFSGVAKNSFYVENGEIKYPISETMIAGNLAEILMNIRNISKERVNFGSSILPWIKTSGVMISGK